jgi:tetratricopeptide (TPR) repeat protein
MSFLKGLFGADPVKSAAKHEKRARRHQAEGNESKAADEWGAAGHNYSKIPDYKRAYEAFLQAAQFYLAVQDDKRETAILFDAVDAAIAYQDFTAASSALDQVTRVGTRNEDDRLLIRTYSLQTILLLAANDLAKSKQTHHEAIKLKKRIGKKKIKTAVYAVASLLVQRFIEGDAVPQNVQIPTNIDESETINQLISTLLTLYQSTEAATLKLTLDKEEVKIKEQIIGHIAVTFSVPTQLLDIQVSLPSNIALLEDFSIPPEPNKKFKIPFTLEPRLPGIFDVGPFVAVFQIDKQQFQFKSNPFQLEITAAKPRLAIIAEPVASPHSQEEFELILRVENDSHGDAADVTLKITLPPSLLLQTGTLEKRILSLPAQQNVQFPLFLIATKAGTHEVVISCKYQGPGGTSHTVENKFGVEILPRVRKEKD